MAKRASKKKPGLLDRLINIRVRKIRNNWFNTLDDEQRHVIREAYAIVSMQGLGLTAFAENIKEEFGVEVSTNTIVKTIREVMAKEAI